MDTVEKGITIVLITVLVVSMAGIGVVGSTAAQTEQAGDATISLGDVEGSPGEEVTVSVEIDPDDGSVAGYTAGVEFNPDDVSAVGVAGIDFDDPSANIDNDDGFVFFTQSQTDGVEDPTVAEITFKIDADAEAGSSTALTFDEGVTSASDEATDDYELRFEGGSIGVLSEPGTLDVTVVDEWGDSLGGANVDVFGVEGQLVASDLTAPDGEVDFELDSGEYTIFAYADGFSQTIRDVTIVGGDEATTIVIELENVTVHEEVTGGEIREKPVSEGQTVKVTGLDASERVQIREVVAGSIDDVVRTEFRLERFVRQDGTVVFDSDRIGTGLFTLSDAGESVGDTGWEVTSHDIEVEFVDEQVSNSGESATTDLELQTNRSDEFTLFAREDDDTLSQSELGNIFGDSAELKNGTPVGVIELPGGDVERKVDFTNIDGGTYQFTFEVTDTVAADTASIDVGTTAATYADDDGKIGAQGVLTAFADFQSGEIEAALFLEVFNAWQSGEEVA